MKKNKLFILLFAIFAFTGCQKELHWPVIAPPDASFNMNCAGIISSGVYAKNRAMRTDNILKIEVNVLVPGPYNITTDTLNKVSFSGSGILEAGVDTIVLIAKGTPVSEGDFEYTISTEMGICHFTINYAPPPVTTGDWSYKIGNITYSGIFIDYEWVNGSDKKLGLRGQLPNSTNSNGLYLVFSDPSQPIAAGLYSGTSTTNKSFIFQYSNVQTNTLFSASPQAGTNMNGEITSFNLTTGIIEGRFSGTAREGNQATGAFVDVTDGRFRAVLP